MSELVSVFVESRLAVCPVKVIISGGLNRDMIYKWDLPLCEDFDCLMPLLIHLC